jgi:hypothetical protein
MVAHSMRTQTRFAALATLSRPAGLCSLCRRWQCRPFGRRAAGCCRREHTYYSLLHDTNPQPGSAGVWYVTCSLIHFVGSHWRSTQCLSFQLWSSKDPRVEPPHSTLGPALPQVVPFPHPAGMWLRSTPLSGVKALLASAISQLHPCIRM